MVAGARHGVRNGAGPAAASQIRRQAPHSLTRLSRLFPPPLSSPHLPLALASRPPSSLPPFGCVSRLHLAPLMQRPPSPALPVVASHALALTQTLCPPPSRAPRRATHPVRVHVYLLPTRAHGRRASTAYAPRTPLFQIPMRPVSQHSQRPCAVARRPRPRFSTATIIILLLLLLLLWVISSAHRSCSPSQPRPGHDPAAPPLFLSPFGFGSTPSASRLRPISVAPGSGGASPSPSAGAPSPSVTLHHPHRYCLLSKALHVYS